MKYIYQSKLEKTCFQRDVAYGAYKYLPRRTVSENYWVIRHNTTTHIEAGIIIEDQQWANQLHNKPINRKSKERKTYLSYGDKIWGTDPADMHLISKYIKGVKNCYALFIFTINMVGFLCSKIK